MENKNSLKIGVFRGGTSNEYDLSRITGANIIKNLSDKYIVEDISVLKNGDWNEDGMVVKPSKVFLELDLAINALHGGSGEDGKIQKIFEEHQILYTGSNSVPSAISLKKPLAKKIFKNFNIKTPYHRVIDLSLDLKKLSSELFNTFPMPIILKPVSLGSSEDIYIAREIGTLWRALYDLSKIHRYILVEEYIEGISVSCGVIDNFRDEKTYSLLPVEIKLGEKDKYFNYLKKEDVKYICPSNLSEKIKKEIQEIAKKAHNVLNLRHYSKSDFIVSPSRGVYLLEINALPDLSEKSPFVKSLNELGISFSGFLDHIINLALNK